MMLLHRPSPNSNAVRRGRARAMIGAAALALTAALPMQALAAPISGLTHLWRADGNTADAKGGVTGSFTGAYGAGVSGQAFSFTGANPLFSAAVDIGPNNFSAITFGAWINLATIDNNRGWVIGHDNGGFDRSLILHDSRFNNAPAAGTGTSSPYASSLAPLSLGDWHFVAVSYAGNGQQALVYSDGATQLTPIANNNAGNPNFTVGGLANFGNHEINGLVDDVFIFNRALSASELDQLRTNGIQVPVPAPVPLMALGLVALFAARRARRA